MSVLFDKSQVQQCYDYLNTEIENLKRKKVQALSLGNAVGYQLAKMIDGQIEAKQEELESVEYALHNMT